MLKDITNITLNTASNDNQSKRYYSSASIMNDFAKNLRINNNNNNEYKLARVTSKYENIIRVASSNNLTNNINLNQTCYKKYSKKIGNSHSEILISTIEKENYYNNNDYKKHTKQLTAIQTHNNKTSNQYPSFNIEGLNKNSMNDNILNNQILLNNIE